MQKFMLKLFALRKSNILEPRQTLIFSVQPFCRFPDTCGQLRKTKIGRFEAEELALTWEKNFQLSQKERFLELIEESPYIVNYW